MGSYVEEQIAARISRVKEEAERRRVERAERAARRRYGVDARNAWKAARLAAADEKGDEQ